MNRRRATAHSSSVSPDAMRDLPDGAMALFSHREGGRALRINFGPYRWCRIETLDTGYLEGLLKTMCIHGRLRDSIQTELARRRRQAAMKSEETANAVPEY
jgi:hypothetical protein